VARLVTGKWPVFHDKALNQEADLLGPALNIFVMDGRLFRTPPAFVHFRPKKFLRRFDASDDELDFDAGWW
jgi:hypothetical protein